MYQELKVFSFTDCVAWTLRIFPIIILFSSLCLLQPYYKHSNVPYLLVLFTSLPG